MIRKLTAAVAAALVLAWAMAAAAPAGAQQVSSPPFLGVLAGNSVTQNGPARLLYSFDPAAIDVNAGKFNFGLTSAPNANLPGSSHADTVWVFGYNTTAGGTRQNSAMPSLGLHWESEFWQGGAAPAAMEFHIQFTDTTNAAHRPFGLFLPHNGGTGSIGQLGVEKLFFNDFNGNQKLKFDWSVGTMLATGALQWQFDTNNYAPFAQRNAANSAYLNLPYYGSDNRLHVDAPAQWVGATPTTGTYPNIFAEFQPTSFPTNGTAIGVQLPPTTGAVSVFQMNGSSTGAITGGIYNANGASGADAVYELLTAAAGGNPYIQLDVNGVSQWRVGTHRSDGSKFKIASGLFGSGTDWLTIDTTGKVGLSTASPTGVLDVNDSKIRVRTAATPASASASCNAGEISWDTGFVYVCVATNTWKRAALTTW